MFFSDKLVMLSDHGAAGKMYDQGSPEYCIYLRINELQIGQPIVPAAKIWSSWSPTYRLRT